jgi:phosphohistidine phosphatase SixA
MRIVQRRERQMVRVGAALAFAAREPDRIITSDGFRARDVAQRFFK